MLVDCWFELHCCHETFLILCKEGTLIKVSCLGHNPAKLPVMDAVARVLHDAAGPVGMLELSLDEEGGVVATGTGADWFLDTWRGDIALDAAAGMLLSDIKVADDVDWIEAPDALNETAVKALSRRVEKVLAAVAA